MQAVEGTKPPYLSAAENVATARALFEAVDRTERERGSDDALYEAFEARDRRAAERLLADDFHFFNPQDNGLDRRKFFDICWPQAERFQHVTLTDAIAEGDRVFVTYEAALEDGDCFRNAEVLTVKDGRVSAVEVYFGWSLPHPVAEGEHAIQTG